MATWQYAKEVLLFSKGKDIKGFYTHLWRKQWHPTPVLLPGKSHGWRSLGGCSPWGHKESHTTERLHFHVSLSCIGEGNGNPLQCSCLENPRDREGWWAAIYGFAQSRTCLKQLSSSMLCFLFLYRKGYWKVLFQILNSTQHSIKIPGRCRNDLRYREVDFGCQGWRGF